MFSGWDFARSAEAMFSRRVVKRVCKFLLKKKLGDFILGDIDLDQLDVQITQGTIHLSDLALNVDFINQKLAGSSVMVKEGSVGSLSIKIPWKLQNCEIEVDELELVLVPFGLTKVENTTSNGTNKNGDKKEPEIVEAIPENTASSVSLDIHEGVKTIAKMVKWFLTSFHIRLKKLIVAFDPLSEDENRSLDSHQSLVLRIAEIEFGTRVSEDPKMDSLTGRAKLTNFVKFQGAVIEFLKMDDVDKGLQNNSSMGTSFSEWQTKSPSFSTTAVLTGANNGFSGTLNLSIPWKNGSLDMRKVDADLSVDPIELILMPNTIKWMVIVWESLRNAGSTSKSSHFNRMGADTPGSVMLSSDAGKAGKGIFLRNAYSENTEDTFPDALLPRTHVIHNWVPLSLTEGVGTEIDQDYGSSIDQFFECYDGMRSSQAGSSSIWNWTCSVFSAITVASNLASGSGHIPIEQHNVERSIQATIKEVSVSLFFHDEDLNLSHDITTNSKQLSDNFGASHMIYRHLDGQSTDSYMSCYSSMNLEQSTITETKHDSPSVHHLEARCHSLLFSLQISPQKANFEASVLHFKVDGYHDGKNQLFLTPSLQNDIQDSLPLFKFPTKEQNTTNSVNNNLQKCQDGLIKIVILESFGTSHCHCSIMSTNMDKKTVTSTSFSFDLRPFIFWIHFPLVNTILNFFKKVENFKEVDANKECGDTKEHDESGICSVSSSHSLQGKVNISQARVVICFPSDLDRFIALELYPASKGNASDQIPLQTKSSTCVHFGIGNFDLYLIDHGRKYAVGDKSAVRILSCANKTSNNDHGITIICQNGPVTGAWMANRAWNLASSHEQRRNKVAGKSSDFSSMTTGEDIQEKSSNIRQELILSSALFLHVHFSYVWIDLDEYAYNFLNQFANDISIGISGEAKEFSTGVGDVSQTSFLVDCDALNINIILSEAAERNHSIEKELEGSWNSVKLTIEKLELFSVSNIGGIYDSNLFWLSHGEGELWGSIFDRQDFLLITCKNSTIRRGDGKGANALSFGPAGTIILYMWNPQLLQSCTSVSVRCGTIIAPGGRMDWIDAICLFFGSSSEKDLGNGDVMIESRKGSFFLDLVDVALSYEPHSSVLECNERIGETYVAGILAAASLSISSCSMGDHQSETINYNIQLKDIGMLLCESSGLLRDNRSYHACSLKNTGYVKVAQTPLVEVILRIKGMYWEVDCSDSHINIDTCQDTTNGLIRLVAQLQLLYAPDMEDAIAHLQSRWNTIQQTHNTDNSHEVESNNFDNSPAKSNSEMKQSSDSENRVFTGLLDDILENAFNVNEETNISTEGCKLHSHLPIGGMHLDEYNSNKNDAAVTESKTCLPQIIESYYISERSQPLKSKMSNVLTIASKPKSDIGICKDIEYGKGVWYQDSSFTLVEDHVSRSSSPKSTSLNLPDKHRLIDSNIDDNSRIKGKIIIKNIDVRWRMYAGLDWSKRNKDSQSTAYLHGRDKTKSLELTISGLNVLYSIFLDGEIIISKLSACIQYFHLYDRSKNAPWSLVLGDYMSKDYPRESCAKAFNLNLEVVRPDPLTPIEDYRLNVELLPIRLHLDQDQLDFLISFFGKGPFPEECCSLPNDNVGSELGNSQSRTFGSQTVAEEALLPFFQKCEVKPLVICVDYIPRHIDVKALRKGNYAELLNFIPLKGIELKLKHACAVGVYGWGSVCGTIGGQWLEDISHNQVHKVLKGVAPVRSLFAVSSGTSKLVSLPVKSYKKDQKILKGMQRGAIAFLKSISLEAVGLGVHLAAGAHEMLWQTEYIFTSVPSNSLPVSERSRAKTTVRRNQPEDAQQGIHQAYESITDGLGRTASALIGTPLKVYQRGGGAGSALASAVRGAPAAAIAPVAASARAVHYTLVGVRNSLDPERKRESKEKYHGPSRR